MFGIDVSFVGIVVCGFALGCFCSLLGAGLRAMITSVQYKVPRW